MYYVNVFLCVYRVDYNFESFGYGDSQVRKVKIECVWNQQHSMVIAFYRLQRLRYCHLRSFSQHVTVRTTAMSTGVQKIRWKLSCVCVCVAFGMAQLIRIIHTQFLMVFRYSWSLLLYRFLLFSWQTLKENIEKLLPFTLFPLTFSLSLCLFVSCVFIYWLAFVRREEECVRVLSKKIILKAVSMQFKFRPTNFLHNVYCCCCCCCIWICF